MKYHIFNLRSFELRNMLRFRQTLNREDIDIFQQTSTSSIKPLEFY